MCIPLPGKIAIIDDSAASALLVKRLLETGGAYEAEAYRSAEEFIRYEHRAGGFSLIILDIAMPGAYGLQALEEMRRHPDLSRIPLLLLVGDAGFGPADAGLGLGLGANSLLPKPIDPRLFMERVRSLLEQ